MGKAVLISVKPKWVKMIADGEKTIAVRKTAPKLEPPFKCYIYCTDTRPFLAWADVFCGDGHSFGGGDYKTKFTYIDGYSREHTKKYWNTCNGRVAGEFLCEAIYTIDKDSVDYIFKNDDVYAYKTYAETVLDMKTGMTDDELRDYLGFCTAYAWHISDVCIYDKPRELSEFTRITTGENGSNLQVQYPPQSWYYVRVLQ